MTSILARSPLQHMSMNRAAHITGNAPQSSARRRSARQLETYEDDAGPPAKRAKADHAVAPSTSRANGGQVKRGKKTYEEADDGFAFSRAKTRKDRNGTSTQGSAPSQTDRIASNESVSTEPKKRPRKTLPQSPADDDTAGPRLRRSKRLSGDADERTSGMDDPFTARAQPLNAHARSHAGMTRHGSPPVEDGVAPHNLHVPKKRGTKIDLILAETPVIRRNKAMRQTSSDSTRRSSAGLRGKRASSLMDAGSSTAVPHVEVDTKDFYKHISQDLMEPRRMKQLLVWCARRAFKGGEGSGGVEQGHVNASALKIQEELLSDFASRSDISNWFDRQDDAGNGARNIIKQPNPRNIQNAARLVELETELERLQAEKQAWDQLLNPTAEVVSDAAAPAAAATADAAAAAPTLKTATTLDPTRIDVTLLAPSQAEILQALLYNPLVPSPVARPAISSSAPVGRSEGISSSTSDNAAAGVIGAQHTSPPQPPLSTTATAMTTMAAPGGDAVAEAVRARLERAASGLEFKIDLYRDALHRMERYVDTAGRAADKVLAGVADRLEDADRQRRALAVKTAGGDGVGGGSVDAARDGSGTASGSAPAPAPVPVGSGDALRALGKVMGRKRAAGGNGGPGAGVGSHGAG